MPFLASKFKYINYPSVRYEFSVFDRISLYDDNLSSLFMKIREIFGASFGGFDSDHNLPGNILIKRFSGTSYSGHTATFTMPSKSRFLSCFLESGHERGSEICIINKRRTI